MAIARVETAAKVKPGLRRRMRHPKRTSLKRSDSHSARVCLICGVTFFTWDEGEPATPVAGWVPGIIPTCATSIQARRTIVGNDRRRRGRRITRDLRVARAATADRRVLCRRLDTMMPSATTSCIPQKSRIPVLRWPRRAPLDVRWRTGGAPGETITVRGSSPASGCDRLRRSPWPSAPTPLATRPSPSTSPV